MTNFEITKQLTAEQFADIYARGFACRFCEGAETDCKLACKKYFVKWLNSEPVMTHLDRTPGEACAEAFFDYLKTEVKENADD